MRGHDHQRFPFRQRGSFRVASVGYLALSTNLDTHGKILRFTPQKLANADTRLASLDGDS
jgi:hypothetical protein